MATLLISTATLVLPNHPLHLKEVDILIQNGKIKELGKKIRKTADHTEHIQAKGAFLAPGFFDLNTNFGEPGFETKEDIQSGTESAAAGGFTGVAVQPNTMPPIHTRSEVSLIVNLAKGNLVDVFPVGSVSKKREGKELAELYDMQSVGAIAFSDGDHSIQQSGVMSRGLLYGKGINALIMAFAQDESLAGDNQMNEGEASTYLGMKGVPNLAESLMISRDLGLAEYHDAAIHFSTISTAESVELIKRAKNNGVKVTCDVAAHHLVLTDEDTKTFDSNYKVSPPLRTKKDVKALLKGLKDDTIDAIVSQHTPHEVEYKKVEFQAARHGISSLQTVLPMLKKAGLSVEQIVEKLAIKPREILQIGTPAFEVGEQANMVLFDLEKKWLYNAETNLSKGENNPWFGQELTGKVIAVLNNNKIKMNK